MMLLQACKIVLPSSNMEESLRFYRDLGFTAKLRGDTVAELSQGGVSFYLKAVPPQTSACDAVMIVTVPSLCEWWIRVKLLELGTRHRVRPPREPASELWGEKVGYLYDPSGTAWHFMECEDANAMERASPPRRMMSSRGFPDRSHAGPLHAAYS